MAIDHDLTLGLDFGTTNTVLAAARPGQSPQIRQFGPSGSFRTVLTLWQDVVKERNEVRVEAGPAAIERFIADPHDCRFLQSFKSFAASSLFSDTQIHGRRYQFEDLLVVFLECLAKQSGGWLDHRRTRLVIGRPVTFAGANPDADLALARYNRAFERLGFTDRHILYEPVAAAFFFAQQLTKDATVLVADFGGGTSDFSVIRFLSGPKGIRATPLSHSGVGIAGDRFDYRIIDHVVAPRIGKGSHYRSFAKLLEIPNHHYANFARWNTLPLMKSAKVLRELRELQRTALDPAMLEDFIEIIEDDLAYPLYRAVSDAKIALSQSERTELRYCAGNIDIRAVIDREAFDSWIAEDVRKIGQSIDDALQRAGLRPNEIDRVFLTGGTSFVPAVRALFDSRFDSEKIATGNQFDSIAGGLALIGQQPDLTLWSDTP